SGQPPVEKGSGPGIGLRLRNTLREVGCPSSLQYSLVYLFGEFLTCLNDPVRCDAVLDLYESFAALSTFVRADADRYFAPLSPLERRRAQAQLFAKGAFRDFVEALQNAFTLRLQRAIPRHETRDTAFSFRGGINKFITAMDAPLKCCLGL